MRMLSVVRHLIEEYRKIQGTYPVAIFYGGKELYELHHNKRDLERMLENESHQRNRDITRKKNDPVLWRIIGKTTYVANLHFKEQGQTFAQKLKRVLKADCS